MAGWLAVVVVVGLGFSAAEAREGDVGPAVSSVPPSTAAAARVAKEAARRDATAMYVAFLDGDLDRYASYAYPGLLKLFGGKLKLIATIEKERPSMEAKGLRIESAEVGAVTQLVETKSELQAILPLTQVMTVPGGEVHMPGSLLGISEDRGKTWTFMDSSKLTSENVRQVLPTYDPRLKLPGPKEPKFIRKERPAYGTDSF